jgi:hypothetical protein
MRWFCLAPLFVLAGCASPGTGAELRGSPDQIAHKLYVTKCAKCHKLYDPAKYSDDEWQMWMGKMSRKSKLTAEQRDLLSNYIEETFRKPAVPR